MKKTLSFLAALLLLSFTASPYCAASCGTFEASETSLFSRNKVNALVSSFSGVDGVEVVHIGSVGMSLARTVTRIAALDDSDARQAVKVLKGLKSLTVMDFEDASPEVKERIARKASKLFTPKNLLVEAVDDGEKTSIYGDISPDGGKVKNFVVFSPESGTLVCLFGTFDLDSVMKYID